MFGVPHTDSTERDTVSNMLMSDSHPTWGPAWGENQAATAGAEK